MKLPLIGLNSMTKRFATLFLCLLAAVAVGACQTVAEKRKIDYKSTRTLPPLDIPPDLAAPEGTKSPEQGKPPPPPPRAPFSPRTGPPGGAQRAGNGGPRAPRFFGISRGARRRRRRPPA